MWHQEDESGDEPSAMDLHEAMNERKKLFDEWRSRVDEAQKAARQVAEQRRRQRRMLALRAKDPGRVIEEWELDTPEGPDEEEEQEVGGELALGAARLLDTLSTAPALFLSFAHARPHARLRISFCPRPLVTRPCSPSPCLGSGSAPALALPLPWLCPCLGSAPAFALALPLPCPCLGSGSALALPLVCLHSCVLR